MAHQDLKGKRVLIFQQRGWGMRVGHFFAKQFQAAGCQLAAVTVKRTVHRFVKDQTEVKYELITSYDDIIEDPRKYLGTDDYSLAEICDDLGIDSVWPFVQSLRHHIRSYREKYYYAYRQEVPDEDIIDYVKAVYKNVKYVFNEFRPDLIVAPNIASLYHVFFNLYGLKSGVKMLRVIDSRVRGIGIVVQDYQASQGQFFDRLTALNNGATSDNFKRAKEYIEQTSESLQVPLHSDYQQPGVKKLFLMKKIRQELSPYRQIARYFFTKNPNRLAKFKVTVDDRSPYYILRDHYTHKRNAWSANHFGYHDFTKIKKYIYFPLQFTPEETIDVFAPHFNNQIELVRQVAMSTPADYTVVVKEHPAMLGRRSLSYLEKIARTPNVKLIDYRIPSDQVIKGADLVVNISGTSLAEAAFLKKPAIQFGNLGVTKVLPNVYYYSDFATLEKKIKEALTTNLDTPEYDKKLLNFVAAAYDTGSDADYVGIWWGQTDNKINDLWQAYVKEFQYILSSNK